MSEWKLTNAYVTGLSHALENTPCQDRVAATSQESGAPYYAAVLADGVGSLKNSHIAAKLATDTALNWMAEHRDQLFAETHSKETEKRRQRQLASQMVEQVRTAIIEYTQRHSMDLKTMDCNLAFCFVDDECGKAFVGQLGDCAVCIVGDDSGERRSWVMNDQGMLANSTDSVLSNGSENRVNTAIVPLREQNKDRQMVDNWVYGFILTSDGLENVLYRKGSRCVCKQAEHCINLNLVSDDLRSAKLRELLTEAQESSKGYLDDDLSVVVISRTTKRIQLPEEPYWSCKNCGARNLVTENRCHSCSQDMLTMYPKENIDRAGGVDAYFEYLNRSEKTDAVKEQMSSEGSGKTKKNGKKKTVKATEGGLAATEEPTEEMQTKPRDPLSLGSIGKILTPGDEPDAVDRDDPLMQEDGDDQLTRMRRDPPAQQRTTSLVTRILQLLLAALILALAAMVIKFGIQGWVHGNTPPSTEPSEHAFQPPQTTAPEDPTPPTTTIPPAGEGVLLDSGAIFFGRVVNGQPDGYGTLIEDNMVWTGCFISGIKNGLFTITVLDGQEVKAQVVYFEDDQITTIYYGEIAPLQQMRCVMRYKTRLYATPDYNGAPVFDDDGNMIYIQVGEEIYPTGKEQLDDNNSKWCEIRTESGFIGWCEDSAINRILSDDSTHDGNIPED